MRISATALSSSFFLFISGSSCQAQPVIEDITFDYTSKSSITSLATRELLPLISEGELPMVPVRFISENLFVPVEYDLSWQVFSIRDFHFKVGVREMHRYWPKVGGNVIERLALPFSPKIINGRLYVPMETVLNAIGHKVIQKSKGVFIVSGKQSAPILPPNIPINTGP